MISVSKEILFATKGNNSTSHLPRGVPLWNHGNYILTTLKTMHYPTPAWNCRLPIWTFVICFSSIISDVCFASQLKGCFYASFRELILCSLRSMIHSCEVVLLSCRHVGWSSRRKGCHNQYDVADQHLREGQLDHENRVISFVSPLSSYLTSWISGRDSCLVGVSCHSPSFGLCLSLHMHLCIVLNSRKLNWGNSQASEIF